MEGFTSREPLGGWRCNHCGADTHSPNAHSERCHLTLQAEIARLKDAWESAELRADDGWLEVERIGGKRDILAEKVKQQEAEIDEFRVSTEDCKTRLAIAKRIAAMMRSKIVELEGKINAAGRGE
jgi:hypothetical protein